jgi:ATP phosphoribosyltransferase regulatory subunit
MEVRYGKDGAVLRKPEGFKDLLPEEAALKRRAELILSDLFTAWGYREVVPSSVEYSSIFTAGMKADFEEKLYKFSDERGRTLVLRPDLTLPLARMVATHMKEQPLPLRFFYNGSIFRYLSSTAGRQREFFQSGVELIGAASPLADAELIALAVASLKALGIHDSKICLGNLKFLNSYLESMGLQAHEVARIKKHLSEKDLVSLEEYVTGMPLSREMQEDILGIPRLKGGKEVLEDMAGCFQRDSGSVREMRELFDILASFDVTDHVLVDLGLVRGLDYYTGIVFDGYTSSLGSPICGGGRYDQLLGYFGCNLAAVGFAFHIDNILLLLSRQRETSPPLPKTLVAFPGALQDKACKLASECRQKGEPVELALQPMSLEESRRYALAGTCRN